ncbi:hypothetical protein [Staphylococcus shinii]|uniref:hypothetical protein n=1 Tax=Staphylococcus shinii TaxID=2912228 RepID=UPI00298ED751|nr:hypothetical protein [Staphylococcus shinii]MDW8571175.1 hypothetical protein [Staphylococcus shinii]MDW8572920.1 hypothetical protein [Staphylococcus shinii]
MAYEYEIEISSLIIDNPSEIDGYAHDELKEVYRKAKAWDNYLLCVEEDAKNEFGNNEALVKHAVELNKKIFMEDE